MTAADKAAIADRLNLLVACVNLRQIGDDAPGTLLFVEWQIRKRSGKAAYIRILLYRDREGWNNFPGPDGKRYPVVDRRGNPPYPPAVFPVGPWSYEILDRTDH